MKLLLQLLALVLNRLPKTDWKPIPLCEVYGRYGLNVPNLVGHVNAPSMTTGTQGTTTTTSVIISNSSITSTGGENATVRGICYVVGAGGAPTTSDTTVSASGSFSTGNYSNTMSGLASGTIYSVRAYAINSGGTGYGSSVDVSTLYATSTFSESNIGINSATGNGIIGTGTASITERGFVWSTSPSPTTANSKVIVSGTTGSYSGAMTGLAENTLYYYRTYVTSSAGTNYGGEVTFTTLSSNTPPTLALNTTNTTAFSTATPTLEFTGTDGQGDDVRYNAEVSPEAVDAYETSNDISFIYDASNAGSGQSFSPSATSTLKNASFILNKSGSPTGNVLAKVYAHSGTFGVSSVPTGAALATSDTFDVSALTTTATKTFFTFSGANQIALTSGANYILSIEYTSGTFSNRINARRQNGSSSYAGNLSLLVSGSWIAQSDIDLAFSVNDKPIIDAVSNTDPGFLNTVNGGDTDPFTSGQKVSYSLTSNAGNTAIQSSTGQLSGNIIGKVEALKAGKLSSITAYLQASGAGRSAKYALYRASDQSLVAQTVATSTLPTTASWVTLEFSSPVTISADTYYIVAWADGSFAVTIARDSLSSAGRFQSQAYTGSFPSTLSTTNNNFLYSIYATYSDPLDDGTYYWRVRGLDPSGTNTYGAWSETRSFTVSAPSGNPTLVPADVNSSATLDNTALSQGYDLNLADVSSTNYISPTILVQGFNLSVDDVSSSASLESPTTSVSFDLTVQEVSSSATLDTPTTSVKYTLTPQDLSSSTSVDSTVLVQSVSLTVNHIFSATSLDSTVLTQKHILLGNELISSAYLDEVLITQKNQLVVSDLSSEVSLDAANLSVAALLQVQDVLSSAQIEAVNVSHRYDLTLQDVSSASTVDQTEPTAAYTLTVGDLFSTNSIETPTLTQSVNLTVQELESSASLDTTVLLQANNLSVDDLISTSNIQEPNLTQANTLSVNDVSSSVDLAETTLSQATFLTPSSVRTNSEIETLTVIQKNLLVVSDSVSTSTLETTILTQSHILAIQDASSEQSVDNASLASEDNLAVVDVQSNTALDSPVLFQRHQLAVQDLSSISNIENTSLAQGYNLSLEDVSSSSILDTTVLSVKSLLIVQDSRSTASLDSTITEYTPAPSFGLSVDSISSDASIEDVWLKTSLILQGLYSETSLDTADLIGDSNLTVDNLLSIGTLDSAIIEFISSIEINAILLTVQEQPIELTIQDSVIDIEANEVRTNLIVQEVETDLTVQNDPYALTIEVK